MIICEEGGVEVDDCKDILYDGLFSLVDDILQPIESDTRYIADESTFVFMQANILCHKAKCILKFLAENGISIMTWPL